MMSWADLFVFLGQGSPVVYSYPIAFWLLLIVPFFVWVYQRQGYANDWDLLAGQKKLLFRHSLIDQLYFSHQPQKSSFCILRWLLYFLRYVLLILAVLALASPIKHTPLPPEPQTKTVRDIVFVIESSASMMLEDYQVNGEPTARMEVVKRVVDQFVANLDGNRFSFILYADNAYTLMPITSDTTTARLMLKRLRPYLAGREDAALGNALGLALQQVERGVESTQKSVVILFSDGENKPSQLPVIDVINYAQGLNLPVYTVGVGAGTLKADKRKHSGLLYQTLQNSSLKKIASETNGIYFQVGSKQALQDVLVKIDSMEGVEFITKQQKSMVVDLYPYLLALLLMVFILYFSLVQTFSARVGRYD